MGHWDTDKAHGSKTGKHAEDQKFPTGLLPEEIQSVSNALATLHGRRNFLAHTTAVAEPTDARKEKY